MMTWAAKYPLPQTTRPVYFVQSPPNTDVDKISTRTDFSPFGSPSNRQSQVSHYHHRESVGDSPSTSRFSGPLRNGYSSLQVYDHDRPINEDDDDDEMDGPDERRGRKTRFYSCLLFNFVLAFTIFCLILWGVSKSFSPIVSMKGLVIESLNVQSGNDASGVLTDMLTLNSTVRILYRNPATFFTVHVTSLPLQLSYSQLILASGQMEKFSQRRKTERIIETKVLGNQIPLYGGVPALYSQRAKPDRVVLPLNLTFTLRSRAYVLGRLVKTKFYSKIRCSITFHGDKLGKQLDLSKSCYLH
ncbi:hypothetical protein EUTSA_v10025836mg [Eutrema salsugineum]|uniref:Late embryogenesis abundant protein LEA-2 subgroup domain-containing protein n=1 Tax=Eutrema salsugineum TaxID=72664 RepID=V4MED9_EUTSA|nr:uncharacterized protein LOC18028920 [Eutrema salsugineum]ESQ53592.1 hypothetical protein EUTSA_v10025836mg [Eutrema salsugineum]